MKRGTSHDTCPNRLDWFPRWDTVVRVCLTGASGYISCDIHRDLTLISWQRRANKRCDERGDLPFECGSFRLKRSSHKEWMIIEFDCPHFMRAIFRRNARVQGMFQ